MLHNMQRFASDLDHWLTREDVEQDPTLTPTYRKMLEGMFESKFLAPGEKAAIAKALEVIDFLAGEEL